MFRAPSVASATAAPLVAVFAITLLSSESSPHVTVEATVPRAVAAWGLQTATQAPNFALEFDGFNDLVNLSPEQIGAPASLTVEAWIRMDVTDKLHVLVTNAADEFNDGWTLYVAPTNQPSFVVVSGISNMATATATTPLVVGEWYHVAGVVDAQAGQASIFVNGVQEGSAALGGAIRYATSRGLLFGAQHKFFLRSQRFLRGALDEVRIWEHARSEGELIADMDHELAGDEPGLIGYWQLNEGQGTTTADASGGANAGQLIGGPTWIEAPWRAATELLVTIDVKPGAHTNMIPVHSEGKIPVAIVASAEFDAVAEIDPATLTFGRTGDEPSLHLRGLGEANCGAEDVNADGFSDLVCQFDTHKTDFQAGDNRGILKGIVRTGGAFRGEDWVNAFQRPTRE